MDNCGILLSEADAKELGIKSVNRYASVKKQITDMIFGLFLKGSLKHQI